MPERERDEPGQVYRCTGYSPHTRRAFIVGPRRRHVLGHTPWKRQRPDDDGLMVGSLLIMISAIALFVLIMWSQVIRARVVFEMLRACVE